MSEVFYATGRRKRAIAKVWVEEGSGEITVNKKNLGEYFHRESSEMIVKQPLAMTETLENYNIHATVRGGGLSGQAGALRLGIAKALSESNQSLRIPLKRVGFLTRDSRVVERKKYGQKGARKRFQFSKR